MNTYVGFASAGDEKPKGGAFADGENLADRCYQELKAVGGPLRLPPQLLIFLATPKYLENGRAHDLVPGIVTLFNRRLGRRVPLVGSSTAAVIFKQKVHEYGAVLICLASKHHLDAKVSAAGELTEKPRESIANLVADLGIRPTDDHPKGRPKLLLFLPNHLPGCFPSSFYKQISEDTGYRLTITGGVSYPVADHDPGLQFTEFGVQRGAIVAARLDCSIHVASGLGRSLETTGAHAILSGDGVPHITPEDGVTVEELIGKKGFALLGRTIEDRSIAQLVVIRTENGIATRKLETVQGDERFEILSANRDRIVEQAKMSVTEPMHRVHMNNPVGSLAFQCAACYRYRENIGLDLEAGLRDMEKLLDQAPVVGGFFAGEIGVDFSGHSMLANFAGAALTFGDDLQERFVRQRGFEAIADASQKLSNAECVPQVIEESLNMLDKAGYVGSMISMLLPERRPGGPRYWIVPKDARGERFKKVWASANDPRSKMKLLTEDEVLAVVGEGTPKCIFERVKQAGDQLSWNREYVLPLSGHGQHTGASKVSDRKGINVLGFLHIDLGESRKEVEPLEAEKKVLAALGATVESSLARVMLGEEAKIMRDLDRVMNEQLAVAADERSKPMGESLRQSLVDAGRNALVKAVVDALGALTGYIRMRSGNDLEIVADFGPNCNLIREERLKIDVQDKVLSAQAFAVDETMVLNDAPNDEIYQSYCERWPGMKKYLEQGNSYAIAVLKDALGAKLGIVAIQAEQRWWFYEYHLRCLRAFDERLRTVLNHLENRLKDSLPAQFLAQTCDKLSTAQVNNPDQALKQVVENFQKACAAHVVNLFLWEESLDRFLLYSETGWKKSGWELAAYYEKHQGWTGSVALEEQPRYEPDLQKYKQNIIGRQDDGSYKSDMFGSDDDLATESIGLPLKIGGKPLGVLIAFRRYQPGKKYPSFVTTDPNILAQAGDRITGYVSTLLLHRSEQLNEKMEDRHRAIHRAISRDTEFNPDLEANLCRELRTQYQAEQVFFYDEALQCVASASGEKKERDETIAKVGGRGRNSEPSFETIRIDESTRHIPELAAFHGLLQRVCIPLVIDKLLGVIDMRWRKDVKRPDHVLRYGYEKELKIIGAMIASVYQRYKTGLELQQEKNKAESVKIHSENFADAMVAPAKQALHRCNNLDALLEGLQSMVTPGSDPDKIKRRIDEIRFKTRQLPRAMRFLKAGVEPKRGAEQLKSLVEDAVREFDWGEDVKYQIAIDPEVEINVNRAWIVEAFFNIIDNAIHAIRDKGQPGTVTISATALDKDESNSVTACSGKVRIVFKDTGLGMSKEETEVAFKGADRPAKLHRTGVGIPLTRVLLEEQGGKLEITSRKGFGTEVIVDLPATPIRRTEHGIIKHVGGATTAADRQAASDGGAPAN